MGTSKSSSGAPSGVPMVPPWTPDPESDSPADPNPDHEDEQPKPENPKAPPEVAPKARFRSTRLALGDYASSGDRNSLRRGVGRYFSSGLGGSRTAARRMGGTSVTAGTLYGALGGNSPGASVDRETLDTEALKGKSAEEVIKTVIDTVRPVDGTQEGEATRESINDAMAELLNRHPEANLLELNETQREFVIDQYVSMDVFRQFYLDVGKTIQDKAPSATTGVARLKEAREYIRETVCASFRRLREAGTNLSGNRVSRIINRVLVDAFDVFSGYAE